MISTPFERGRRLFTAASLATLLLSALHIFGTSQPVPPLIDPITQAMQNTAISMGFGMVPSMWDVHQGIAYAMGILLGMIGALGLVLAATTDITGKALTRTAAVFTVGFILLAALNWVFRLPIPFVITAILALLWGTAQRTTRLA